MSAQLTGPELTRLIAKLGSACAKSACETSELGRLTPETRTHLYGKRVLESQVDMLLELAELHRDFYPSYRPSWLP